MRFLFVYLNLIAINAYAQCIIGDCNKGTGKYIYPDGIYEGTFYRKLPHGNGSYTYHNGDLYKGAFVSGKKHGIGKFIYSAFSYYIGDFQDDLRHGKGKMVYENGNIYKGHWKNGYQDGNGTLILPNKEIIDGVWSMGNIQKEESSNATDLTLQYKNCTNQYCHNEVGAYYYADGSVFYGKFINGYPEGYGICEYSNGNIYKGEWKEHGPHGQGTFNLSNGKIVSGTFQNGKLLSAKQQQKVEINSSNEKIKSRNKYNSKTEIYAVVVGVASYHHMKSLKYTDDDAYQLYAFLKSPQGGALPDKNISILIDDAATKQNIQNAITSTFSKADENDVVILYLSGHGLNGSFVPHDFDGRNNLLYYQDILNTMNSSRAKNKLWIADACHSGSISGSRDVLDSHLKDYYNFINRSKGGLAVLTSSKANEVSLEFSGMRQGVFSHFLIKGLKGEADKNNDKIIDVMELYSYVKKQVKLYTNNDQNPTIEGKYDNSMPVAMIYSE